MREHADRNPSDPVARPANGRSRQYQRAKLRHLLFTAGPDRLTGGRLRRRHLAQDIEVRQIELRIPGWPDAFDGMRIGHISDLHVGDLMPVDRALEVVALLREQEPDLVACTGDVVDLDNAVAPPVLEAMAKVDAPLGAMLVLGNHDYLDDGEAVVRMAESAGVVALRNELVEIVRNQGRLVLAGADWGRTVRECTANVRRAADAGTNLLLAHNPKAFIEAARLGVQLTLAGHTHGGQLARRGKPNHNLAMAQRRSRGLYRHDDAHLYVTTGVGAWFPLRVNCPAEIAIITVRSEPPSLETPR